MPRPNPKALLMTATNYLKRNPEEVLRLAKGAFGMRLGIPLDAIRHLITTFLTSDKAPRDVVVEVAPPGMRWAATIKLMGTTLRAKGIIFVEEVAISSDAMRFTLRIADLDMQVLDGADTPVAGLIKSGALDLSKPGNLAAYMPKRPEALVDAQDDKVVVDLLKVPKIAKNDKLRRTLGLVTPVFNLAAIKTKDDHIDLHFRATPTGIGEAIAAAQSS